MFQFQNSDIIRRTPILNNNNSPDEWAKFAYAIFQCGFFKPECSFNNNANAMNMPEPGYVFPSNFFVYTINENNLPSSQEQFIKVFRKYQDNGATIVFSTTSDDKNRINVIFIPKQMYDNMSMDLKQQMPMINCFCDANKAEKALDKIMSLYESL